MTAVFKLLSDAREVLGLRGLVGEMVVIPAAVLVWILAMGFAPALSSPTEPVPVSALRASIPIAGETR